MTKAACIASVIGLAVGLVTMGPQIQAAQSVRYFPSTGHSVAGRFLEYFQSHGELRFFGNPITEETPENGVVVQYFERARFELQPVPDSQTSEVKLGLLGTALTKDRDFPTVEPFARVPGREYFPQTKHSLAAPFHDFWFGNNGVEIFGYPISEQLKEGGILSQYFERGRLEYHPELPEGQRTTVGLVGLEYLAKTGNAPPSPPKEERWKSVERGAATYYGAEFNGRRTSSGAPFDMYALTAANRTLPLGSRAKVTNLASGKSVIVTINDRGPWVAGRILDLSQEAFSRIAPVSCGVVWVDISVPLGE